VQRNYSGRLSGIYRIDRNAELESEDQSDAEIAVVLADGPWQLIVEQQRLGELTFDALMETEVYVRAWPISVSSWRDPSHDEHPGLVRDLQRHAVPIMEAA